MYYTNCKVLCVLYYINITVWFVHTLYHIQYTVFIYTLLYLSLSIYIYTVYTAVILLYMFVYM